MPQVQRLQTFIFQTEVRNTVKPVEKNTTTDGIGQLFFRLGDFMDHGRRRQNRSSIHLT